MNEQKAYEVMQKASGIKIGDTVSVQRAAISREMGWGDVWLNYMDPLIGEKGEVRNVDPKFGIYVHFNSSVTGSCYWFPFFVLEKVRGSIIPTPIELPNGTLIEFGRSGRIRIRDISIGFDLVALIYEKAKSTIKEESR